MRVTGAEKRTEVPAAAAGYSAEDLGDGRARFQATIAGLHCSLCAGVIERGLYEQSGVDKVSVTGPDTQALVDYDPGRVGPEQLLQTLDHLGFGVGDSPGARRAQSSNEDTAKIVREGRRFLQLVALSAVVIVLMALGLLHLIGSWSYWVLGVCAIASLVIAPELLVATVQSRQRGLLANAPVVRASAFAGLVGGVIGLAFRPAAYPTGGFFAVTALVITYHVFWVSRYKCGSGWGNPWLVGLCHKGSDGSRPEPQVCTVHQLIGSYANGLIHPGSSSVPPEAAGRRRASVSELVAARDGL